MISVHSLVFNAFSENTFIIHDESATTIIIDPGCYEKDEEMQLINFIDQHELTVKALMNTHCHIDHVLGNAFVSRHFGVPLQIYEREEPSLRAVPSYASNYGFPNYEHAEPITNLTEEDGIAVGDIQFDIVWVPGHATGHIAFINEDEGICISGDVLFDGSIGRTDLPGGDYDTLISSIQHKLFCYSDDMVVYCGHGPTTTIGKEKQFNPFCAIS